jgi:thymidylate synthase (FAD)
MRVIQQSYEILTDLSDPMKILKDIERAGRVCYKSENNITEDSCITFCKSIISRGHEAVIEHSQLSVRFTVDRAIANELVRHRIASYCQESTRFVNYSKDKFCNEIKVIEPEELLPRDSADYGIWWTACKNAEDAYMAMLSNNVKPEIARNVLPLSTATEIIMTANIREWRSVLKLRSSHNKCAHPQMRSVCDRLLAELKSKIPVLFDDIAY